MAWQRFGGQPRGRYEMAADLAFKQSDPLASIDLYTTAIAQAPAGNPSAKAHNEPRRSLGGRAESRPQVEMRFQH